MHAVEVAREIGIRTVIVPAAPGVFSAFGMLFSDLRYDFVRTCFTRLEDAIYHHLNVFESARNYNPMRAGLDKDLALRLGPVEPVLARVDPLLARPIDLTPDEFESLVAFVRTGLLDRRAEPRNLCSLVPASLPSGMTPLRFEECPQHW